MQGDKRRDLRPMRIQVMVTGTVDIFALWPSVAILTGPS
jgi:hypothetical protein